SPDPADPSSAQKLNQWASNKTFERWGRKVDKQEFVTVPTSYKVSDILTYRDETGSTNTGVSQVTMVTCKAYYYWSQRGEWPCFLVGGYWSLADPAYEAPRVHKLSETQADQWVQDPIKAVNDFSNWSTPVILFKDYVQLFLARVKGDHVPTRLLSYEDYL